MTCGAKRTMRPLSASPAGPGARHSTAAVPDSCTAAPGPKSGNSSAAAGSAARLPSVLNGQRAGADGRDGAVDADAPPGRELDDDQAGRLAGGQAVQRVAGD